MGREIPSNGSDLADCSGRAAQAMAIAALDVVDQMQAWALDGQSVLHALIGNAALEAWQHYPDGDARDPVNGFRWYYHCHAPARPSDEHGHFHLFSEAAGHRDRPTLTHLIAIGLDAQGSPIRVFTVNRWVTDEVWRDATQVLRRLQRFRVEAGGATGDIGRWLAALTRLFAPQIRQAIVERDATMHDRARGGHRPNLRDDRRLEVISQRRLSLAGHIEAIDARLAAIRARSPRKSPASLAHREECTA